MFVAGMLLTVDGPWEFDQLRIAIGLLGYLPTFVTGVAVLIVMAAIFVLGLGYSISRAQAVGQPGQATA